MAYLFDFTVTQNSERTLTLNNIATGSDPNITAITISLFKFDGSLLNGITYDWPVADTSVTLTDVLDRDYALNIEVVVTSSSPDPDGTYTVTKLYDFYWFSMLFAVSLSSEVQARYPDVVNDTNFINNKFALYTYIIDSQNAVSLASNISLAQMSLDSAYKIIQNQANIF